MCLHHCLFSSLSISLSPWSTFCEKFARKNNNFLFPERGDVWGRNKNIYIQFQDNLQCLMRRLVEIVCFRRELWSQLAEKGWLEKPLILFNKTLFYLSLLARLRSSFLHCKKKSYSCASSYFTVETDIHFYDLNQPFLLSFYSLAPHVACKMICGASHLFIPVP